MTRTDAEPAERAWPAEVPAAAPRSAVITGGARGLGAAAARRLRADGVSVTTLDLTPGADITADVTDMDSLSRIAGELGEVDVLVNSAGIVGPGGSAARDDSGAVARGARGQRARHGQRDPRLHPRDGRAGVGRVVNIASMAGKDGNPNLSIYSASKAAVIGLTKSIGKELALSGVIVNAIAPAVIDTPMNAETEPSVLAHITSLIPMQRVGRPEEVAELIAFLASDRVSFSTGAVYDLSGGRATY